MLFVGLLALTSNYGGYTLQNPACNGSMGKEQGLLRLLRSQPHRKYQSLVHNFLFRTHQFVQVPKLPLLENTATQPSVVILNRTTASGSMHQT